MSFCQEIIYGQGMHPRMLYSSQSTKKQVCIMQHSRGYASGVFLQKTSYSAQKQGFAPGETFLALHRC